MEVACQSQLERIARQFEAVGVASQIEAVTSGDAVTAARELVQLAARVTGCARVNAWLFSDDATELRCIAHYDSVTGEHSSGAVLKEPDFRAEFHALKTARYVDADDAVNDPRTAGYAESYLKPFGITAMLDAVIRVAGAPLGLLCFEHVHRVHHWEQDEIGFACQLADKLGLALMTERRLTDEDKLRRSESALAEAQGVAQVGSWQFQSGSGLLTWSAETYELFGVDRKNFTPSYDTVLALIHPGDRAAAESGYRRALEEHTPTDIVFRIVLPDGSIRHLHERGRTDYAPDGTPVRAIGTVQDVTERETSRRALELANIILTTQMEASPDGILIVGADRRIILANRRFSELWSSPARIVPNADATDILGRAATAMKDPEAFRTRTEYLHAHPEVETGYDELETLDGRTIERHSVVMRTPSGESLGRVWFHRDITARKRAEMAMLHTASHDALTGLANRRACISAIAEAIARSKREETSFVVLSIDLDHFKDVNDTLGHPVGDELLRLVAERLRTTVRDTDTVARFGGDEFAVIASGIGEPMDAAALAGKLVTAIAAPFWIGSNEIHTGASIGITIAGSDGTDAETLLSHADIALYRAKADGRAGYRFFTSEMDTDVHRRVTLRNELRKAIGTPEMFLMYQPEVDLRNGNVTAVEALIRWQHPVRGLLPPSAFIPAAEESGLIIDLGKWVLREACLQSRRWLDAGFPAARVAVNLSVAQLKTATDLEAHIVAVLEETGLPPALLELELTETVLMVVSHEHGDVLSRLRTRGVRLAIDDFGTGYSSLDYLRRFPVDQIKVAQDFVAQICTVNGSAAIVKATLGLARELGIPVLAEGVETADQLALLKDWGCRAAQGYYFARPVHADLIGPLLLHGTAAGTVDNSAAISS